MRVVAHRADVHGCGQYRVGFPAQALIDQGYDLTAPIDHEYTCEWIDTIQGPTLRRVLDDVDADVIVIQRPLTRNRYELVGALQAKGAAVVVEIDDDFHAIDRRNPAWKFANPLHDPDTHRDWLMRACQRADLVTCSTQALADRYGAHGRVVVLDNYVPAWYCDIERPAHDRVRVGWSGSTVTHPGDLEATGGGVGEAIAGTGAELHVVGTGVNVRNALGSKRSPIATGWLPIGDYPAALARLDVGIVPLLTNPFNEAKSHLKGLEYASVGVPFVATPTGPYRRLAALGLGTLAESPAEWCEQVSRLVADSERRRDLSAAYREEVRANWTVEKQAHRWWEAWEQAMEHAQMRAAA